MAIDTSGLSGYAEAFADALNNGASYADAYAAATAATGGGDYSYFNDSGGISTGHANGGVSGTGGVYTSSLTPSTAGGSASKSTNSVAQSMINSLIPTKEDLLNHEAVVRDYLGNPVAIDFSKPDWQNAWSAMWGAGNQIVTDSTNRNEIGKSIGEVFRYDNANPLNYTGQAARGQLVNYQGQQQPVSSKTQQYAQNILNYIDRYGAPIQAAVAAQALQNNKDYYKSLGQPMPEEYNRLAPGGYTLTPLSGGITPAQVISAYYGLSNLSPEEMAQINAMTPQERSEFQTWMNYYQGGGV